MVFFKSSYIELYIDYYQSQGGEGEKEGSGQPHDSLYWSSVYLHSS